MSEFPPSCTGLPFCSLVIILTLLVSPSHGLTTPPQDNHLINCGSALPSTVDPYNRDFIGDESTRSDSVKLTATRTASLTESTGFGPLYDSVRIFTHPSSYAFEITEKGPHLLRIHFHRLNFDKFDGKDAKFHVLGGGFLLLSGFGLSSMRNDVEVREFVIFVDGGKLELDIIPVGEMSFGFVSAIEVVSAPKDLILDVACAVGSSGVRKIDGVAKNGFETLFRVNVGGPKVTPFNDTLWRTWVPDHEFLKSSVESRELHFGGRIKYRVGGASREVAPDHVYGSARMVSGSGNLTWGFPVVEGYKYLVRTHFCDIVSRALGSLYFNVYVNGNLAYEELDLSTLTNSLASPYYADFVVDGVKDGVITVTVGNSTMGVDAILNGVEVFKMSNSVKSFDGMVSAESILRSCEGGISGFPVIFCIAIGVLLAVSLLLRRVLSTVQESVGWSRLPVDMSEVALKSNYQ